MARKLASVQTVLDVLPIENADLIETVKILGWNVVVSKSLGLKPGDRVVYYETDSLLPADDPRYVDFIKRGTKTAIVETPDGDHEITGHILRTAKLRGVISQGLVLSLAEAHVPEDTPVGTDVTNLVNVYKYEEPLPVSNGTIIGRFDTRWAPQSDAMRIQALGPEIFDELTKLQAEPTVKVDGTSTTLVYFDGNAHVYSRNWELSPNSTQMTVAREYGLVDAISEYEGMSIQFELCGPGIQSNRLKLRTVRPFVFAVFQNRKKLPRAQWPKAALDASVPVLDADEWKLDGDIETMVDKVNDLRGNITRDILDEGIVWHLDSSQEIPFDVFNALGSNLNYKIINNKYLLKHGL